MPKFVLLLRDDPSQWTSFESPAEMQKVIQKYIAWGAKVKKAKQYKLGHKLQDGTGAVLSRGKTKTVITDGPFAETKEIVSGFYVVEAKNLAAAKKLCEKHPHLEYGSIEVREVEM